MATIIYDGECGICLFTRRTVERLDMLGAFEWIPFQNSRAESFGIPRRELEERVWLVSGQRRWSGFAAAKQILLRLPPLWAAAAYVIARKPKAALGIGLFFSPLFAPVGERVYKWVSEHRHRMPLSSCGVRQPRCGL